MGLGEDGPDGLPRASREALEAAEIVMGPPRHLALLPDLAAKRVEWPAPFAEGLKVLDGFKGAQVVVLASGDPFWFGAGSVLARRYSPDEWRALPVPSVFSHACSRLGWALERAVCLGLHAKPVASIRRFLAADARLIITLRDGDAVAELAEFLRDTGFGASTLHVMEALGGPRARITLTRADALPDTAFRHPVAVAIEVAGDGAVISRSSGLPDDLFETDGVMTKRHVRAITLSGLAPRSGERLWDIGGGSGSIAIEWLLADPRNSAVTIEPRADRVALIEANAASFGVDRLEIVTGAAPDALSELPYPDAVFIGGGISGEMLTVLDARLPKGTRVVANAVTLEAEALLADWQARKGGDLTRIEIAHMQPMGDKRGWKPAFPVVQWSVTW